jgi:FixJ family two-component response regulator
MNDGAVCFVSKPFAAWRLKLDLHRAAAFASEHYEQLRPSHDRRKNYTRA